MAANTSPIFPVTPIVAVGANIATNTARTLIAGTTTNTGVTATSTNGLRVDAITVTCFANSAAATVTIWIYDGTNQNLFMEIPVSAVTVSNTVAGYTSTVYPQNLVVPPTYRIFAATTISQSTNVYVLGGTY